MSDPDEVRFACIGCGTYNAANAEVCGGCGHRFAGPDLVPKVRIALAPRATGNPYEAPRAAIAPPRTFRIGSLLAWIAVIAVCLAAFRENIALGILAAISFVPPSLWVSIVARERQAEGWTMDFVERSWAFFIAMMATWAILFAGAIAFFITCLAGGSASNNISFGLALGATSGVACVFWLVRLFIRTSWEAARREREIRYR